MADDSCCIQCLWCEEQTIRNLDDELIFDHQIQELIDLLCGLADRLGQFLRQRWGQTSGCDQFQHSVARPALSLCQLHLEISRTEIVSNADELLLLDQLVDDRFQ